MKRNKSDIAGMRLPSWVYSVRTKLTALASAIIALISIFIYWYFPAQLENNAMKAVAERANSIAMMMACNVSFVIKNEDRSMVCDFVISAQHHPDLDYVMVLDDSNRVVATFDSARAIATKYVEADFMEHVSLDGQTYKTVVPIVVHQITFGKVYVGLSLKSLKEDIARNRSTIAWVSAAISVSGILCVILLSTLITTPLGKMLDVVEQFALGDWKQRAMVYSKDEVGQLASAFNTMMENLESAYDDLRNSEKNYRDLFESNPHPMWVHDVDTLKFLDVNDAALESYGYSREEFLAMTINDIILDAASDKMEQLRTRQGNLYRSPGWSHVRKDGSVIEVEISSHPLPLHSGRRPRLVLASDITKSLQAEALLRESEERHRVLSEATFEGISVTENGVILDVNMQYAKMLGYECERLIGKDVFELIVPDERGFVREQIRLGKSEPYEHRLVRSDGSAIFVEVHAQPYKYQGRNVCLSAVRDITARKIAEEALLFEKARFEQLFENAPVGIVLADKTEKIIHANTTFQKIFGYSSQELSGRVVNDLIMPEHLVDEGLSYTARVFAGESIQAETVRRRKDMGLIDVDIFGVPIVVNGSPIGLFGIYVDVTARKQADREIRLLAHAISSTRDCVSVTDLNDNVIFVNDSFLETYGYSREELIGKPISIVRSPLTRPEIAEKILPMTLAGNWYGEIFNCRKDGRAFPIDLWTSVVRNEKNEPIAAVGVARDITEQKRAEEALLASEAQLIEALKISRLGYWERDFLKDEFTFNDQFYDLLHTTAEREGGYTMPTAQYVQRFVHPEDAPIVAREGQLAAETTDPNFSRQLDHRIIYADGEAGYFTVRYRVLKDARGRTIKAIGVNQDITERTRADEAILLQRTRFEQLFENAPIGIVLADKSGRVVQSNKVFQSMFGYRPEDLSKQPIDQLIVPDDLIEEGSILSTKIFYGEPIQTDTVRRRKDGSLIDVGLYGVPILVNGSSLGLFGMYVDITRRKEAEQRQAELMGELESINEELNDFAYIVSHDLKAPLRAIGSLANWLSTDYGEKLGEEGNEMLKILLGRTTRMHDLIDGVLRYSRIGRTKEVTDPVELDKIVPEIVEMIAPPSTIEVKIHRPLPIIMGEATRIQQVFQNLLSNAVKFMDKQKGLIHIGCQRENGHWKFNVSDNGPGIEGRHFDKVFKMFQTLSPRDDFESTGIGLTIVKKIVEMHQGKIWIESNVGAGTTFYFTFPAMSHSIDKET